jgi:hypothetical protein
MKKIKRVTRQSNSLKLGMPSHVLNRIPPIQVKPNKRAWLAWAKTSSVSVKRKP